MPEYENLSAFDWGVDVTAPRVTEEAPVCTLHDDVLVYAIPYIFKPSTMPMNL